MQTQPDDWAILPLIFPSPEEAKKDLTILRWVDSQGFISLVGALFINLPDIREHYICGMSLSAGSSTIRVRALLLPTLAKLNLPSPFITISPGGTLEIPLQGPCLSTLRRVWLVPTQGPFNGTTATLWIKRAEKSPDVAIRGASL